MNSQNYLAVEIESRKSSL